MTVDRRPAARSFGWIIVLWLCIGVSVALQTVVVMRSEGMHHPWLRLFLVTVVAWLPWAFATPLVFRLAHRLPPTSLRPLGKWLPHALLCIGIALAFAAWTGALHALLNPYGDDPAPGFLPAAVDTFANGMTASVVLYAGLLAVHAGLVSRAHAAQAQIDALRRQIEPHFLFNTLNGIATLVREERNDAAVAMIVTLGDFLRRTLADREHSEIALEDELAGIHEYVAVQKMRFDDRLRIDYDIAPALLTARVPALILQPLVENAIEHGIAKRREGGVVRVAVHERGASLAMSVWNDGPPLATSGEPTGSGIGLANVRSRVRGLYGARGTVDLRNAEAGGVVAAVTVPLRR